MSVSFTGSLTLYLWRSPRYSERAKRTTCPRCDQRGKANPRDSEILRIYHTLDGSWVLLVVLGQKCRSHHRWAVSVHFVSRSYLREKALVDGEVEVGHHDPLTMEFHINTVELNAA